MSLRGRRVLLVVAAAAALAGILGILVPDEHVSAPAPATVAAGTAAERSESVSDFVARAGSSVWRVVKDDHRRVDDLALGALVPLLALAVARAFRYDPASEVLTPRHRRRRHHGRAPPVPRFA